METRQIQSTTDHIEPGDISRQAEPDPPDEQLMKQPMQEPLNQSTARPQQLTTENTRIIDPLEEADFAVFGY